MQVILVDENDSQIGVEEKILAHKKALLHRAFSIFIFNENNETMLQQRATSKYHSPGLWTNTCCSHPSPGSNTLLDAQKRLQEEMGFTCDLKEIFSFTYKTEFDNGLTEYEFDHVLIGTWNNDPIPNPDEVDDWKWISLKNLQQEIIKNPELFTSWLKICLPKLIRSLK